MTAIARGQVSSPQNPVLAAFFLEGGEIIDPEVIEYAIFERVADDYPLPVYPPEDAPEPRVLVDLRDSPIGDRLSPGRYLARWAASDEATVGRYEIRWWYRARIEDTVEMTFAEDFEVIADLRARGPAYALVADMRDEGVPHTRVPDVVLHSKLVRASRLFELYTGRTFAPAYRSLRADGRGRGVLYLGDPIIAVDQVYLAHSSYVPLPDAYDGYRGMLRGMRVYNRHIAMGLLDPDDRDNPRIEYAYSGFGALGFGRHFTQGHQNVLVRGVFGYTDVLPEGPPAGVTPEMVSQAVRLLAMRDLPRLNDLAEREDHQKRWRLTGESTREQSYSMFGGVDAAVRGAVLGGTTGDPEIDNIIILYRRGAQIGAA